MEDFIDTTQLQEKEYLSVPETMNTLGVSQNTLYRYFKRGHLKPVKYRNKNYIRTQEIREYLSDVFGDKV